MPQAGPALSCSAPRPHVHCPVLRPCVHSAIKPSTLSCAQALCPASPKVDVHCPVIRPCAVPCHQTLCPILCSNIAHCIVLRSRVPCPALGRCALPCHQTLRCPPPSGPCCFPYSGPVALPALRTRSWFCPHALSQEPCPALRPYALSCHTFRLCALHVSLYLALPLGTVSCICPAIRRGVHQVL